MRFLINLLRYMVPVQVAIIDQGQEVPSGFDFVITNTNNFVVTSSGNFVIAKN